MVGQVAEVREFSLGSTDQRPDGVFVHLYGVTEGIKTKTSFRLPDPRCNMKVLSEQFVSHLGKGFFVAVGDGGRVELYDQPYKNAPKVVWWDCSTVPPTAISPTVTPIP
jgi:hypothetical protein